MKKTNRIKAELLETEAAFIATVNEAAALQSRAQVIIAERDAEIVALKMDYEKRLAPIGAEIELRVTRAAAYAEEHRKELLPKDRKSVELATAVYGWRTGTKAVGLLSKKFTEALVIAALKSFGFAQYVRTVEEISKEKILADVKLVDTAALGGGQVHCLSKPSTKVEGEESLIAISNLGLKITQSEKFYIEPKAASGETLNTAAA